MSEGREWVHIIRASGFYAGNAIWMSGRRLIGAQVTEIRTMLEASWSSATDSDKAAIFRKLEELNAIKKSRVEPIRIIQHFACTGGTLFSRCLQAQPNATLLSEVDPISTIQLKTQRSGFAPTDPILLARSSLNGIDDDIAIEMFIASIDVLRQRLHRKGRRLIIRAHAHSQFCTEVDWASRPTINDMLSGQVPLRSVITLRHPIDSFISLENNNWRHFSPFSVDEYCLRYIAFLDRHPSSVIIRYEMLVSSPDETVRMLCDHLELPYNSDWPMLIPAIRMSGDSGRRGNSISPRPRRDMPSHILQEAEQSKNYHSLCERLGYDTALT